MDARHGDGGKRSDIQWHLYLSIHQQGTYGFRDIYKLLWSNDGEEEGVRHTNGVEPMIHKAEWI